MINCQEYNNNFINNRSVGLKIVIHFKLRFRASNETWIKTHNLWNLTYFDSIYNSGFIKELNQHLRN